MAGAYHAPLAGGLFIAEICSVRLVLASLGPVTFRAVVALLTHYVLNGSDSLLYTVHLTVDLHAREYVMIVSTGTVMDLCGRSDVADDGKAIIVLLTLKTVPATAAGVGRGLIIGLLSLLPRPRYGETAIASYNHFCSPRYSLIGGILSENPAVLITAGLARRAASLR